MCPRSLVAYFIRSMRKVHANNSQSSYINKFSGVDIQWGLEVTFAQFIDFSVRVRFGSCTMSARFAKADADQLAV